MEVKAFIRGVLWLLGSNSDVIPGGEIAGVNKSVIELLPLLAGGKYGAGSGGGTCAKPRDVAGWKEGTAGAIDGGGTEGIGGADANFTRVCLKIFDFLGLDGGILGALLATSGTGGGPGSMLVDTGGIFVGSKGPGDS